MSRILHRVWSALRRYAPSLVVTAVVVLAFAALLISFDAASGGITVRLFPGSSVNAAQDTTPTATDTPVAPTPTDTPPAAPTSTLPPAPPPTATPIPVVAATFTCAHAQSIPGGDPGSYMGEVCVHTAPNSPISVDVSYCGVHAAQVISGMTTDASGNWSLASYPNHTDPWTFNASCALPFVVSLDVRGTTPSGETIAGSGSFTVSQ